MRLELEQESTPTYDELRVALENLVNEDCNKGCNGLYGSLIAEIEAIRLLSRLGSIEVTRDREGDIRGRWLTRGAP